MDWLNKTVASGIARQVIQGLGSAGVSAGLYTQDQNVAIAGAVGVIVGVILEIVSAKIARDKLKAAEAAPAVR